MAQLANQQSTTKKIYLPSTNDLAENEKAWVVLRLGKLLGGDIAEVTDFTSNAKVSLGVLASRIQEWNFEDNGQPVPINFENVCRMEGEDIGHLLNELKGDLAAVKTLADPKENAASSAI